MISFSTSETCDCDLPSYEISRLIKPGSDCLLSSLTTKAGVSAFKVTATRERN